MQNPNSQTTPVQSTPTSNNSSDGTPTEQPNPTSTTKKTLTTEILSGSVKTNTVKYEVSDADFGATLKGPVYVTQAALRHIFGKLPKRIRITIEEVE